MLFVPLVAAEVILMIQNLDVSETSRLAIA